MNEVDLEQLYVAGLDPSRTALLAPFGEYALSIAQAATAWRKTLSIPERQDANRLTRLPQTVKLFRDWVATKKPHSKAAAGLSGDESAEQTQALSTLSARDALNDKYQLAVITGLPQFADPATARRVIVAETRDLTRQAAFEALAHGQKTVQAIARDDPLDFETRTQIFTTAVLDRLDTLANAWILPPPDAIHQAPRNHGRAEPQSAAALNRASNR